MRELQDVQGNRVRLTEERDQVVALTEAVPRLGVTPEVSGSPQATTLYGDATSGDPEYFRVTVNAGEDVVAGARLKNGHPDTLLLNLDDVLTISASAAITRIDAVLVGDHEDTTDHSVTETSTEANFRAAMVTYTFDAADDVRTVELKSTAALDAKQARLHVRGASHA